ncbi:MerR family transcriptional regulator [Undibacterium sp. JH2W]|uniref:MerR family transcriptional regulator n=1 Tax=Undibacterium sp. JH2W TaxID=3413037 RepID=UPI003BEF7768
MINSRYFTSKEVISATGVKYRQLDYWIRGGIIKASGRKAKGNGTRRLFTFTDIVEVRAVKRLTESGMRPKALKQCLLHLRLHLPELISSSLGAHRFVTDGKSLFKILNENTLEDISQAGQFCFTFGVDEEIKEVTKFAQEQKRPIRYQRFDVVRKMANLKQG